MIDPAMCDIDQGHVLCRDHLPIGVRRVRLVRSIHCAVSGWERWSIQNGEPAGTTHDPLAAQTDAAMYCWTEFDRTLAEEPDVMLRRERDHPRGSVTVERDALDRSDRAPAFQLIEVTDENSASVVENFSFVVATLDRYWDGGRDIASPEQ
jgi:hypothetical protein